MSSDYCFNKHNIDSNQALYHSSNISVHNASTMPTIPTSNSSLPDSFIRDNIGNLMISEHSKSIPVDLNMILVKLEFISLIKRGYKINTNTMNFVDANSWSGAVRRMLSHENRKLSLDFITRTISSAIDAIDRYEKTSYLRILINSLNTARIGISELASTYRDDPEFVSNIKVCLASIDIQLNKFLNLVKGYETYPIDIPALISQPTISPPITSSPTISSLMTSSPMMSPSKTPLNSGLKDIGTESDIVSGTINSFKNKNTRPDSVSFEQSKNKSHRYLSQHNSNETEFESSDQLSD